MDIFVKLYALLATVPFITFLILYLILINIGISKKVALNYSIYISSIFLISAVSAQIKILFNYQYSFIIVIVWIIIILFGLALIQLKIRGYINYLKLFSSTSKSFFIIF